MNHMRRFSVLLPLLLIWGCSPQKEDGASNTTAPATADTTSSQADANAPTPPTPGKSEPSNTDPTAKGDPKSGDPVKSTETASAPLPPPIPEPGTAGFQPTTNNAVKTLAEVDSQMKKLRDIEMVQLVQAIYPVGRGSAELVSRVKEPGNLLLRYANLEPVGLNYNLVQYTEVKKDGKSQTLVGQKYEPGHRSPSGNVLESWPKNFSHHLVSNFGTNGVNSLSELARLAAKAGWKTSVETKKFDNGSFQRVTLISNSTPKRTYTILVEPNKKLPMELQMSIDDKKKTRVIVALRWRQSDKPLTQEDLDPKIKTAPHVDGEMAKKPGI